MSALIHDFPSAHSFLSKSFKDPQLHAKLLKIYAVILQKVEQRIDQDLVVEKDDKGQVVKIGTKGRIEEYLLKEDTNEYVRLVESEGVHGQEVYYLLGTLYSDILNAIHTRILPTLAAQRMPVDPESEAALFNNLFGGNKMPQA